MLSQCVSNALNALVNRHLTLAPNPTTTIPLRNPFLTIPSLKHVMHVNYLQGQVDQMEDKWESKHTQVKLEQIYWSKTYDVTCPNRAKSFVKKELNVIVPKKARLIQGHKNYATAYQHPREYAAFNLALKGVSRHVFTVDGTQYHFVYAGGYSHSSLSDHVSRSIEWVGRHLLFDERDGKNWDATMNIQLLREEARVYEMLGMKSAEEFLKRASRVLGRILAKNGVNRTLIRYLTAWKRLSGDWNTAAGNTIISMIVVYTCISLMPDWLRPRRVVGYFLGDDYLGLYGYPSQPDPITTAKFMNEHEARCGITPVRGIFQDPLRVTFLSMSLWPRREGGFQFVPRLGHTFCKLFWAKDSREASQLYAWASEVARNVFNTYLGFRPMMRFLSGHLYTRERFPLHWNSRRHTLMPMTTENRNVLWDDAFLHKYGIPPVALDWSHPSAPGVYTHPAIEWMIQYEALDPCDRDGCLAS